MMRLLLLWSVHLVYPIPENAGAIVRLSLKAEK